MLSYPVGTFSLRQLGLQLGSFAFSWPVFVFFAFRASLGDRESRADPRTWYLLGAALWALSSIREGSSYAYFLDFHLGTHDFPSFNVADSAICVGVGIYILTQLFGTDSKLTAAEDEAT